ncbi:MAG: methyltransferase [Oligoflexia bacterium]|nr:methyltransferase [Oligoflexia bacterium]
MALEAFFRPLFEFLASVDYAWQVVSPDRLVKLRKSSAGFDPLVRFFGLGLEVSGEELLAAGLPEELLPEALRLRPAVSRLGERFLAYTHWPEPRVYLGEESYSLIGRLEEALPRFEGKTVLDLGSGCGVLSFFLASHAREVLGLELAREAVEWASASARAQGLERLRFQEAVIGTPGADACAQGRSWDFAVFNPPLAVPSPESHRPHRDGGKLGIEIPLAFLSYAGRHLRAGGEVFCNLTNPVLLNGRSALFERIEGPEGAALWKIEEKTRLNDHFNHTLHRQDRYHELGIQRIELWFVRLSRRP